MLRTRSGMWANTRLAIGVSSRSPLIQHFWVEDMATYYLGGQASFIPDGPPTTTVPC